MLSCSIWFCAPRFSMGGGLEVRCVGRVFGADGAVAPSASYTRIQITLLHPVGIPHYFMWKMHGQTILQLLRIWCTCTRSLSL